MHRFLARALGVVALLTISTAATAAKTDIVILHNGDRITGEAKSLERGLLEFSTDSMGTVYIEWKDIQEIVSNTGQAVELTNGQRFYGPLNKTENSDMVSVKTPEGPVGVSTDDIISLYPVEAGFWDRLDLSFSLGFSWDKASNVGKYNIGVDAEYRNPRFITRASLSSEVTTQESRDDTSRANFDVSHLVYRRSKRYHMLFGSLERNDELGIDLRTLVGAGYGTVPIRSQSNWFSVGGGLAVNHEVPLEGESETNLEAVGMLSYDFFRYSTPERRFRVDFLVFPSLTDIGRWRATFDTTFKLEIFKDLFWDLDFYTSYDSAPVSRVGETIDYGITSSFGYKF
jgi:hypothetical protein